MGLGVLDAEREHRAKDPDLGAMRTRGATRRSWRRPTPRRSAARTRRPRGLPRQVPRRCGPGRGARARARVGSARPPAPPPTRTTRERRRGPAGARRDTPARAVVPARPRADAPSRSLRGRRASPPPRSRAEDARARCHPSSKERTRPARPPRHTLRVSCASFVGHGSDKTMARESRSCMGPRSRTAAHLNGAGLPEWTRSHAESSR